MAESKRQRRLRTEGKRKKSRVRRGGEEAREYEREPRIFDNGAVIEV